MVKRLIVASGCPCSGKSMWIQNQIAEHGGNWVSRDLIRFSLVSDKEEYFSKEKEVLEEFYSRINSLLEDPVHHGDIYCDATHLTPEARGRFFSQVNYSLADEVIGVYFTTSLQTCLKRNDQRKGRAKVPRNTIKSMYNRMKPPTVWETPYNEVWKVNEDGVVAGGEF